MMYEEDAEDDEPKLGARLETWLSEQPEWAIIQAMPRIERQEAFYRIMGQFMELLGLEPRPGRAATRKAQERRDRKLAKSKHSVQARGAFHQAQLEKQQRRAMRLSVARAEELAYRVDAQRTAVLEAIKQMDDEAAAEMATAAEEVGE